MSNEADSKQALLEHMWRDTTLGHLATQGVPAALLKRLRACRSVDEFVQQARVYDRNFAAPTKSDYDSIDELMRESIEYFRQRDVGQLAPLRRDDGTEYRPNLRCADDVQRLRAKGVHVIEADEQARQTSLYLAYAEFRAKKESTDASRIEQLYAELKAAGPDIEQCRAALRRVYDDVDSDIDAFLSERAEAQRIDGVLTVHDSARFPCSLPIPLPLGADSPALVPPYEEVLASLCRPLFPVPVYASPLLALLVGPLPAMMSSTRVIEICRAVRRIVIEEKLSIDCADAWKRQQRDVAYELGVDTERLSVLQRVAEPDAAQEEERKALLARCRRHRRRLGWLKHCAAQYSVNGTQCEPNAPGEPFDEARIVYREYAMRAYEGARKSLDGYIDEVCRELLALCGTRPVADVLRLAEQRNVEITMQTIHAEEILLLLLLRHCLPPTLRGAAMLTPTKRPVLDTSSAPSFNMFERWMPSILHRQQWTTAVRVGAEMRDEHAWSHVAEAATLDGSVTRAPPYVVANYVASLPFLCSVRGRDSTHDAALVAAVAALSSDKFEPLNDIEDHFCANFKSALHTSGAAKSLP